MSDLRYAARVLRRKPGYTFAAVLSLTLGIGANTAVFGLFDALLLKSLPVRDPRQLVRLVEEDRATSTVRETASYPTYDKLRREARRLSVVAVSGGARPLQIFEGSETGYAVLHMVSDNFFEVFGIGASRGRLFRPGGTAWTDQPIAVISDTYWRRHYAGSDAVLGARFRFNNREFTVVGVASPAFRGTEIDLPTDIWVSIDQAVPPDEDERTSTQRWLKIMGRLASDETVTGADAEATAVLGATFGVRPGATGYSTLRGRLSRPVLLLGLVVGLVWLITCANLANLVLAGTASRAHEFAVRRAIGASRRRLLGQIVAECALVSAAAAASALIAALWMSAALLSFLPSEQMSALANLEFELNIRVFAFVVLVAASTTVLFGLLPAIRATRPHSIVDLSLKSALGNTQGNRRWTSRGLLVAEVTMCTLLLVVAGVFLRSLQNLRSQDAGYREDGLLVADVEGPRDYTEARRDSLFELLRSRITALPGVDAAAFSYVGQLAGGGNDYPVRMSDMPAGPGEEATADELRVSPGFLTAMGTARLAGRDFTDDDRDGAPLVGIVNRAFLRRFRIEGDPVGRRFIKRGGSRKIATIEIIGVVNDAKWVNLRDAPSAMYYVPYQQQGGSPAVRFAIRTEDDLNALAGALIQTAKEVDPRLLLRNVMPFQAVVNRTLLVERLIANVTAACAGLALLMAAIGLYGVFAYVVTLRRREIGIRMAVGASRRSVEWMILSEALALLAIGFAIGVPAGIAVTRLVSSMLFGLGPADPIAILAALAVLTTAAVMAGYFPARRAANIDPIVALRAE